jgi:hypothetical protein
MLVGVLASTARAQVNETRDGATFGAKVGIIVKWLNAETDNTTPTGMLRDWNNSLNTDTADTDAVAVLRLVTNVDVRLIGTAQPLTHPESPSETLATFVCVQTDGNGAEDSLVDGTGDPATGFPSTEYDASRGVGPAFEEPRRNFVYVGGGSAAAESAPGGTWLSNERLAELSSSQRADFSTGTLLGAGALVKHISRDGAVLIRVTMRALNGEDFGLDSDDTEAPDLAVNAPYTATVQLTALP